MPPEQPAYHPATQTYQPTYRPTTPPPPYYQSPPHQPSYKPLNPTIFYEQENDIVYDPRPSQAEDVVPPVYNQDFLTPDPNNKYPGPEIYDNESLHGPSIKDEYSGTSLDKTNQFTFNHASHKPPGPVYLEEEYAAGPVITNKNDKLYLDSHGGRPPNGPDYSTATIIHNNGQQGGYPPFKVGLDLYPMGGDGPIGKQGLHNLAANLVGNNNKHEVLFHLNLYSKKPNSLGGQADNYGLSQSFGPISLGR